jgi:hypothetical protein
MKITRKVAAVAALAALALPVLPATAASAAPMATVTCQTATGNASLHRLAARHNDSASKVLRVTAEHSPLGKYTAATAAWINSVFNPASVVTATSRVPAGVLLCYSGSPQAGATVRRVGGIFMDGTWSLHRAAVENNTTPALILRESASLESGHVYAPPTARWINEVFAGQLSAKAHASYGVRLEFRAD